MDTSSTTLTLRENLHLRHACDVCKIEEILERYSGAFTMDDYNPIISTHVACRVLVSR